jgi:endonuclease III
MDAVIASRAGIDSTTLLSRLRSVYGQPARHARQQPIDELIQTILSQHTSDINTERAFASLKARFPAWEAVIDAPVGDLADSIRSGGLADIKAPRIQQVLVEVRERTGGFDLSFLADMPLDTAMDWLTSLPGVGPKTAACVLLFSVGTAAMPVDTHVHRVALRLGMIPPGTTAEKAQALLETQIEPKDRYDAHMLMIRHGRETCIARRPRCERCVLNDCCPSAFSTA